MLRTNRQTNKQTEDKQTDSKILPMPTDIVGVGKIFGWMGGVTPKIFEHFIFKCRLQLVSLENDHLNEASLPFLPLRCGDGQRGYFSFFFIVPLTTQVMASIYVFIRLCVLILASVLQTLVVRWYRGATDGRQRTHYTHAPLKLNTRSAITGVTARHDTGRYLLDGDLATRLDQTDQPTAITGNADIRLRRRVGARRNFASSAPFDGDDRKSVRALTVMHWRTDCLRYIWLSATVNGVFTLYTRAISPVH